MANSVELFRESIYGFKNLSIKLYYKADSLQVYCGFDYEDKLPGIEVSIFFISYILI